MDDYSTIPDSKLAKAAQDYVQRLTPPFLYHHSIRTYLFANAAGQRQGKSYDRELLFVASVMHDLGFAESIVGTERFEVTGADAAKDFALQNGMDNERADVLWDAVALHTSIGISARKRPEIALVTVGSAMDLGGFGAEQLERSEIERVLEEWPRLDFDVALPQIVIQEINRKGFRPYVFTWVSEAGKELIPGWSCPSFMQVLKMNPFQSKA